MKVEIETPRLILRPTRLSDARDITELINNINVSKWLLVVPYPYKLKDSKDYIRKSQAKRRKKEQTDYTFGIELKEEKRIIGSIGIHKVKKDQGTADIGYWLGEPYWQNGYGTEDLQAVVDFAFNKLKLRRLEAGVFDGNPSSGKLLEKLGFKHEGMKIEARICKADGKIKDEHIYGLLKKDYKKMN